MFSFPDILRIYSAISGYHGFALFGAGFAFSLLVFPFSAGADVPTSTCEGSNKDEGGDAGTEISDPDEVD